MSYVIRCLRQGAFGDLQRFLREKGVRVIAEVPEHNSIHLGDHQPPELIHAIRQQRGTYAVEHRIHSVR